jgi:leucyl aminopeptidase
MAKKTSSKKIQSHDFSSDSFFGFSTKPWISSIKQIPLRQARSGFRGSVIVVADPQSKRTLSGLKSQIAVPLAKWQEEQVKSWLDGKRGDSDVLHLTLRDGPVWLLKFSGAVHAKGELVERDPLSKTQFVRARDVAGSVFGSAKSAKLEKLVLDFTHATREEFQGFLVGLEIANYSFAEVRGYRSGGPKPALNFLPPSTMDEAKEIKNLIAECGRLGVAVNMARHLTNLPGGTLTPTVYADLARKLVSDLPGVRVDVWDERRLKSENMNLLLAVGGGAASPPRLVQISYRPKDRGAEKKPVALVGKGVTFDSGGLDLKPSSGMRLMKKDMGGSAAVLALTWWAAESRLPLAIDSYLALAENSVSANSFRPGDIVKARNGLAIEIHNTDAEGRLVLADAISVAVNQKGEDAPGCLIDLATLTGAIKVGLGSEIAGLFTNSDDLAREIFDAGLKRGDLSWRMPLYQPYRRSLNSPFADHVNASDGFGGAITAALFLELFNKNEDKGHVPWAHLDIYAWKDSAAGAWIEGGGSGQGVLALTEVLARFVQGKWAEG